MNVRFLVFLPFLLFIDCFGEKEQELVRHFAHAYGQSICLIDYLHKTGIKDNDETYISALSDKFVNRMKFEATLDHGDRYKEYGKVLIREYVGSHCKYDTYLDGDDLIQLSLPGVLK